MDPGSRRHRGMLPRHDAASGRLRLALRRGRQAQDRRSRRRRAPRHQRQNHFPAGQPEATRHQEPQPLRDVQEGQDAQRDALARRPPRRYLLRSRPRMDPVRRSRARQALRRRQGRRGQTTGRQETGRRPRVAACLATPRLALVLDRLAHSIWALRRPRRCACPPRWASAHGRGRRNHDVAVSLVRDAPSLIPLPSSVPVVSCASRARRGAAVRFSCSRHARVTPRSL
mmetsp:Transcript_16238/g.50919  ORF Transcript_16238/g.50919 Transcript_16238/m.50919 type:complete len:228 (+) Transcript_16238:472-1155(+)